MLNWLMMSCRHCGFISITTKLIKNADMVAIMIILGLLCPSAHGYRYNLFSCYGDIERDTSVVARTSHVTTTRWMQDSFCITGLQPHCWLRLRINRLNIPLTYNCVKEKLVAFADRANRQTGMIAYCGQLGGVEILVKARRVELRFEGLVSQYRHGFQLTYHCVKPLRDESKHMCELHEYACYHRRNGHLIEFICLTANHMCRDSNGRPMCPTVDAQWKLHCLETSITTLSTSDYSYVTTAATTTTAKTAATTTSPSTEPLFYECAKFHRNLLLAIEMYKLCDGKKQCPYGDDEMCSPACNIDEFYCDARCLSKKLICDEKVDCSDGRDEICTWMLSTTPWADSTPDVTHNTWEQSAPTSVPGWNVTHDTWEQSAPTSAPGWNVTHDTWEQSTPTPVPGWNGTHDTWEKSTVTPVPGWNITNDTWGEPTSTSMPEWNVTQDTWRTSASTLMPETTNEWNTEPILVTVSPTAHECTPGFFLCREAQRCVPQAWVCDNYPDCASAEDEMNCTHSTTTAPMTSSTTPSTSNGSMPGSHDGPENCTFEEIFCPKSRQCISMLALCDRNEDCKPFGEDESPSFCNARGAGNTDNGTLFVCPDHEFACLPEKTCIPISRVCDSKRDCLTGLDEKPTACSYYDEIRHPGSTNHHVVRSIGNKRRHYLPVAFRQDKQLHDFCGYHLEKGNNANWKFIATVRKHGIFICGAMLIDQEWVLAPSSAFTSSRTKLKHLQLQTSESSDGSSHKVKRIFYIPNSVFILLQLDERVEITSKVFPACLSFNESADGVSTDNCRLIGYGAFSLDRSTVSYKAVRQTNHSSCQSSTNHYQTDQSACYAWNPDQTCIQEGDIFLICRNKGEQWYLKGLYTGGAKCKDLAFDEVVRIVLIQPSMPNIRTIQENVVFDKLFYGAMETERVGLTHHLSNVSMLIYVLKYSKHHTGPIVQQHCAGVRLDSDWVVTSAHCSIACQPTASSSCIGYHFMNRSAFGRAYRIVSSYTHPNYSTDAAGNGIGLLTVRSLSPHLTKILPYSMIVKNESSANENRSAFDRTDRSCVTFTIQLDDGRLPKQGLTYHVQSLANRSKECTDFRYVRAIMNGRKYCDDEQQQFNSHCNLQGAGMFCMETRDRMRLVGLSAYSNMECTGVSILLQVDCYKKWIAETMLKYFYI